jgi:hypothetical protein
MGRGIGFWIFDGFWIGGHRLQVRVPREGQFMREWLSTLAVVLLSASRFPQPSGINESLCQLVGVGSGPKSRRMLVSTLATYVRTEYRSEPRKTAFLDSALFRFRESPSCSRRARFHRGPRLSSPRLEQLIGWRNLASASDAVGACAPECHDRRIGKAAPGGHLELWHWQEHIGDRQCK